MSNRRVPVCDGCDAWAKTPDGEWLRSIAYIRVHKYSRTHGVNQDKYHLCEEVYDADGDLACIDEDFNKTPDGLETDITWVYDCDHEFISGARWLELQPYVQEPDSYEKQRIEFPGWLEEMAEVIETIVRDDG